MSNEIRWYPYSQDRPMTAIRYTLTPVARLLIVPARMTNTTPSTDTIVEERQLDGPAIFVSLSIDETG